MCPIVGCQQAKSSDHLMCRRHWFQVPPLLRSAVWRTWRALQADPGNEEKHAAYQRARDAAIAATV